MGSVRIDDTTARARVRDTAILLFGRNGYAKTSVRSIAQEAGVSAALVIHHFGTKDGLRRVCDEHTVSEIMERHDGISAGDASDTVRLWLADADSHRPLLDYLSRMLTDDSDLGDELFDRIVEVTEQSIRAGIADGSMNPVSDARTTAVLVASQGLSQLTLSRHVARALGETGITADAIRRMTVPCLELYTHGLYRTDAILEAARDALASTGPPPARPAASDGAASRGAGSAMAKENTR